MKQRKHRPGRRIAARPQESTTAVTGPRALELAASAVSEPHDPALFDQVHADWLEARWQKVASWPAAEFQHHPDRARIAALQAAALQQMGDRNGARGLARQALHWGCSREQLGRTLLAGARHTLARASLLAGRDAQSSSHFERAALGVRMSSELRRIALARHDALAADLRAAVDTARKLREQHTLPAAARSPAWITALVDSCTAAPDLHAAVDRAMEQNLTNDDDRLHLVMGLAERMLTRGDRMTALHFLNTGRWFCGSAEPATRGELMRRLVAMGAPESAMDVAVRAGLTAADGQADLAPTLLSAYRKVRDAAQASTEHGHELLLAYLDTHIAKLKPLAGQRSLVLVEVGTTREDVPGQGSTLKLAEFCLRHGVHFITVDMDPHNTQMARATFQRLGATRFEAITAKGEDYLRSRSAPIDFAFLDAYDFDHGKHSELRQSRYVRFLGARIDEEACHRMHLDCAQSLRGKLWAHGAVCIDDTWREDGRWTAKGTLAMPYLLAEGFNLVDARNRAALLVPPSDVQAREAGG